MAASSAPRHGRPTLDESRERAHAKLQEKWAWERARRKEPEPVEDFSITFHCTFSEFKAVQLAVKGFFAGREQDIRAQRLNTASRDGGGR